MASFQSLLSRFGHYFQQEGNSMRADDTRDNADNKRDHDEKRKHSDKHKMNFTSKEDFRVYGLEKIQPAYAEFDGKMYAGMLPADNRGRTGMTQFWLFEPTTQLVPDTIVLWLNGGPGCSSFNCGVMMEHSPVTQPLHDAGYCCLKPSPQLSVNEHAWTKGTTMLYVEHPIGTGFSFGHPYPENEQEASGDLDAFLQNFYDVFTHLKTSKFYVFGESYAGMFVPSVSRYFHLANKEAIAKGDKDRFLIPISGAAIGNGWIDAKVQGPATIDYSWYHGLIDKPTRDALHNAWDNCMKQLGRLDETEQAPFHPFTVQDDCGIMWGILQAAGNPNAYDVTTWDPNVDQITFTSEVFYNQPEVKEALHVLNPDHHWSGCQAGSGRRRLALQRMLYMNEDRPVSVVSYIADLVNDGIPVILYNGDRDMTTNMVGTELCINDMEWDGKDGWLDAPRGLWKVNDYPAGWAKEYKNLYYVVVYNSGHMVPYNVPNQAFDLLVRFMKGESFIDVESPQIRVDPIPTSKLGALITTTTTSMIQQPQLTAGETSWSAAPNDMMVVAAAIVVGFILGMLFTKRRNTRGYSRVPDIMQ